jgi:hypothetical protein
MAVFIFPFFVLSCIKLRQRQKVALCGVFSLGAITLAISLARFTVFFTSTSNTFNLDDTDASRSLILVILGIKLTNSRFMVHS